MFFSSSACKWLKPMCKMGNTFTFCPGADAIGDLVSHGPVDFLTGFYRIHKAFIGFIAQVFTGSFMIKNIFAKYGGDLC